MPDGDGREDSETVAVSPKPSRPSLPTSVARLVRAIRDDDDEAIEAVLRLSRSRRVFAPLAFAVGALAMLFSGLRLLLTNWRLTLVQIDRKSTRLNSSH